MNVVTISELPLKNYKFNEEWLQLKGRIYDHLSAAFSILSMLQSF